MLVLEHPGGDQRRVIDLHRRYGSDAAVLERLQFCELRLDQETAVAMLEPGFVARHRVAPALECCSRLADHVEMLCPAALPIREPHFARCANSSGVRRAQWRGLKSSNHRRGSFGWRSRRYRTDQQSRVRSAISTNRALKMASARGAHRFWSGSRPAPGRANSTCNPTPQLGRARDQKTKFAY